MEQMELIEKQDYENFKEELSRKLDETAENFIVIGYILKQVRDRNLYRQENYSDIYGFGLDVYGLSKSTVNRFINMNTKFSVGGNSREIKSEYKGYGRSKIQEMLNVDEYDMELITADTTVDQVKELKKAESVQKQIEKADQENSLPLIRMAAKDESGNKTSDPEPTDPFEALITAFWRENTELYHKVAAGLATPEIAAEEISPSGSMTYRNGVNIMFFYDIDKGLKLRSYEKGKAEITPYTYQEFIEKTRDLDPARVRENGKKVVEFVEDMELPVEEAVATPQPDRDEQDPPYVPVPGQTSVSDLQGVMPDADGISGGDKDIDNVIDGEYRELDENTQRTDTKEAGVKTDEERPYTDVEIKNALSFFETEYSHMIGLQQNTAKRRNYKIALECIRRCYKMYGTGVC